MKIALASIFCFSAMTFSATQFGAFTDNNQLYVTILGDCNTASASLVVNPMCRKDRQTENYASECQVDVVVMTTRMFCTDQTIIPKVFAFDLAKEMVAAEAVDLELKYQTQAVKVKVNK